MARSIHPAWLRFRDPTPGELIEPFAGGAIVGLTAAFERLAESVRLIREAAGGPNPRVEFTPERVRAELDTPRYRLSLRERAFKTVLRNRVQRGGILALGAGV